MSVPRQRMTAGQGQRPEFHLQDFSGGQHTFSAREALADNEMWWCENLIPLGLGNLSPVLQASASLGTITETASPVYAMGFNIAAVPYAFVSFPDGTGWVYNLNTNVATKIINSGLTTPYATQYSNLGILIIDPSGYWDYGVTTPLTLTPWNNSVSSIVLGTKTSVAGGTALTQHPPSGTGGSFQINYQVISATINAAGTGYVVGDVLSFTDGSPVTPASVVVSAIGGGGTVTGIASLVGGNYPGPNVGPTATGPTGTVVSGGTGTGATFNITIQAFSGTVISPGHGYTNGATATDTKAGPVTITNWSIVTSGVIGGTAIATYAGRVWIALNRTVYVTDINSYSSFGGAGFSFTINDAYLFNKITVLFAANNYLYLFGATSIDAISNVTVSATTGLTSFTRINIVQGIGTQYPASVFAYYRTVAFYDPSGFYILSGATPEKISEKISDLVNGIAYANPAAFVNAVYGGNVFVEGELCASFSFIINDTFSGGTVQLRALTALFFRRRWWIYAFNTAASTTNAVAVVSVLPSAKITVLISNVQDGLVGGLPRRTITTTTNHFLTVGEVIVISGVVASGTFQVNGTWTVLGIVDSTHFLIQGSGDPMGAYTSGGQFVSQSGAGELTLYQIGWVSGSTVSVYQGLFPGTQNAEWVCRTKFWDGNAVLREKQPINAAIAAIMANTGSSSVTFTTDTEYGVSATSTSLTAATSPYSLIVASASEAIATGASQYLGLTFNGAANALPSQVKLIALTGEATRDMMR